MLLLIIFIIKNILFINATKLRELENDKIYSRLGPNFNYDTPRQFPIKTDNKNEKELKNKRIKEEHLISMLEIEKFFKNISELPCVLKKRQNVEKMTGTDPFLLFN